MTNIHGILIKNLLQYTRGVCIQPHYGNVSQFNFDLYTLLNIEDVNIEAKFIKEFGVNMGGLWWVMKQGNNVNKITRFKNSKVAPGFCKKNLQFVKTPNNKNL